MKTIDVCLSPDLLHLYSLDQKIVVVVDILRATSCMTTGLAHGVRSITPFADMEECMLMGAKGFLTAGERNGKKVEGFDLGNSPFDYMQDIVKDQEIAVTTTNGTLAIEKSREAAGIVIGSFLNLKAVESYLKGQNNDVLVLCAGWKGKVNLEDTLFAGALVGSLKTEFEYACDAPMLAETTYTAMREDLLQRVQTSSHAKRLNRLNIQRDIEFCLSHNVYEIVPIYRDGKIVAVR